MKRRFIIPCLLLWSLTALGQQVIMQHPPIWVYQGGAVPPASDLILQYLMGANGDEANITLDNSGNNYTGTVTDATWVAATNGLTDNYDFDGSGDYITYSDAGMPTGNLARTISVWVRHTADSTDAVWEYGSQSGSVGFALWFASGNWTIASANKNRTFAKAYDTRWHHIVASMDDGDDLEDIKMYYDGVLQATSGNTSVIDTDLTAGWIGINAGASIPWEGDIWGFEAYSTNFSAAEVLAINRTQAVQLGILSEYVNDNLSANLVFDWEANSLLDDGSTNHIAMSTASAPTMLGDLTNGWGSFNGSANVVTAADNDVFTFGDGTNDVPFSLEAWIKRSTSNTEAIMSKSTGADLEYVLAVVGDRLQINRYSQNQTGDDRIFTVEEVSSVGDTAWHYTVMSYDGTNATLYTDGIVQVSSNIVKGTYISMENTVADFNIGSFPSAGGIEFTGLIEGVRVHNTNLSSNQQFNLFSAGRGN